MSNLTVKRNKAYWRAVAVMVGYIVGAGMFGLPFISARAGILIFLAYIVFLGFLQYFIQLFFGSIICTTKEYHQLPGYAGIYLGRLAKSVVFFAVMVADYTALLAYIILSGIFLNDLLFPFFGLSPFTYAILAFTLEALIVYFGIKIISRFEFYLSGLLFVVILMLAFKGSDYVLAVNYLPLYDWSHALLPYGAALFALEGTGILPSIARLMKCDAKRMKSVIRFGQFFSALITIIFVMTVLGISGSATAEDALTGIRPIIGNGVMVLALVFGTISIVTSTLGVLEATKDAIWRDFGLNPKFSWFLAAFIPLGLYVFGIRDLIDVISFGGAIAGGFCAIMLLLVFLKMKKSLNKLAFFKKIPPNWAVYLIIIILACGLIYNLAIL